MKKLGIKLLFLIVLFLTATVMAETPPERFQVNLPRDQWRVANNQETKKNLLIEYVPVEDNISNWKKLVTVTFTSYDAADPMVRNMTAKKFADAHLNLLRRDCPDLESKFIKELPADVIYRWQIKGCGVGIKADQVEYTRVAKGIDGFNTVHYAVKTDVLTPKEEKEMLDVVQSATFSGQKTINLD